MLIMPGQVGHVGEPGARKGVGGGGGGVAADSMILLERQTIGTAAPQVDLTSFDSGSYTNYRLMGWFGFATDFRDIYIRLGTSSGFLTADYRFLTLGVGLLSDEFVSEGNSGSTIMGRAPADASGDANSGLLIYYDFYILDAHDNTVPTVIIGEVTGQDSSNRSQALMMGGQRKLNEDNDRIRFLTDNGSNFDKADIALYGLV